MSDSDLRSAVRQVKEAVNMHVGSMRLPQGLQEASRLAPAESEELRVSSRRNQRHPFAHARFRIRRRGLRSDAVR